MRAAGPTSLLLGLMCGLLSTGDSVPTSAGVIELGNVDKPWSWGPRSQPVGAAAAAAASRRGVQLEAGQSVQLRCGGLSSGIAWTRRGNSERGSEAHPLRDVEESRGGGGRRGSGDEWTSTLTLRDLTHQETGEYECSCEDRSSRHIEGHMRSRAAVKLGVYLFITDGKNLFQGRRQSHETQVVVGRTGHDTVLPCAATALDSVVRLYREEGAAGGERRMLLTWSESADADDARAESALHGDGGSAGGVRYDPKLGFVLEALTLRSAGFYLCRAERGNSSQERRVFLHVVSGSQSAIVKPWIHSKTGFSVAEGASITMRCLALVLKGNPVTIQWAKLPVNETITNSTDKRITVKPAAVERICPVGLADCAFRRHVQGLNPVMSAYNRVQSQLRIRSAVAADSGTYVCTATTVGITDTTTQDLSVYDSGGSDRAPSPELELL